MSHEELMKIYGGNGGGPSRPATVAEIYHRGEVTQNDVSSATITRMLDELAEQREQQIQSQMIAETRSHDLKEYIEQLLGEIEYSGNEQTKQFIIQVCLAVMDTFFDDEVITHTTLRSFVVSLLKLKNAWEAKTAVSIEYIPQVITAAHIRTQTGTIREKKLERDVKCVIRSLSQQ